MYEKESWSPKESKVHSRYGDCTEGTEMIAVANDGDVGAGVSHAARLYALKELARRAGVTADFFRTWRVEIGGEETTVYVQPDTARCVRFKNAHPSLWREIRSQIFHTARASWMYPPPSFLKGLIPDFVVPFSSVLPSGERPLFSKVDPNSVECPFDLALSVLLTLSRFEETVVTQRDSHGRFSALTSVAFRDNFLNRPIIDEYGLAFEQALSCLFPSWRPIKRRLRVNLSHDVDDIGLPFSFRAACGHLVRRRHPLATVRDLLSPVVGLRPTYFKLVEDIARMSLERGLNSAVYWKASPPGPHDSGYDPRNPAVRKLVAWLHERGVEMGIHAGYETFLRPDRLLQETELVSQLLGKWPLGGRQHYLRWCPQTWIDWENCRLSYDSSVGFADHVGFRAGTAFPYRPWLLSLNREADLVEVPLLVMDATLLRYLHLTPKQSLEQMFDLLARCRAVGGLFTLLWHNATLIDPHGNGLYESLLESLAGSENFDLGTLSSELY